ncbi:unnamed protein product [Heligmosomoides polygyrus]|uniref:Cadherin domain-containing protein n=1 Tax=Heligmosomoides polygyrus TaxID=6339 RepID=A0A3P8C3B1_HELPZ|nr:unnamed protein product [Heligmosomoides polygyrus]
MLNAPITTLFVPSNAEPQDEILADLPLRVNEGDEDVALSLDPPSDTIAVSPSIAGSNTPIHLLVIDPQRLRNRGGEKLKLQALGLITGKEELLTVKVKVDSEVSPSPGNAVVMPPFEKDEYELLLEHNFLEREIAIVKMKSEPPPETRLELIGPLSERFTVTREGQLVYLTATPCETRCTTPKTFAVLLVATAKDGSSQQIATLGFKTAHPEFLTRSGYGSVINMTVTVTVKKSSTTAPISVTVRPAAEHLKAFKFVKDSYTFTVPPGVTLVGMVELTGAENHTIQYGIAEGSQGVLSIDEQGVLYYHREPEKESRNFTVLVTARSTEGQFFVATTWVEVLVEGIHSNPLRIKGPIRRSAVISADTKRDSKLATIDLSDEDDDATVQMSVDAVSGICLNGTEIKGLPTEIFRVKMTGQQAELSLAEPLSDLPLATVAVQLSAQDLAHLGEPHVKVTQHLVLVRTNRLVTEKPLPFKFIKVPKKIEIPPNTPEGSVVYRPALLQSIVSNSSEFIYDIESSSEAFTIDNKTGTIMTNRRFDDALEDVITVTVTDPVAERSAQVNITVSVAEPAVRETVFSERQYSGSVRKTDPPGKIIFSTTAG